MAVREAPIMRTPRNMPRNAPAKLSAAAAIKPVATGSSGGKAQAFLATVKPSATANPVPAIYVVMTGGGTDVNRRPVQTNEQDIATAARKAKASPVPFKRSSPMPRQMPRPARAANSHASSQSVGPRRSSALSANRVINGNV